jgi:hypothetical protein
MLTFKQFITEDADLDVKLKKIGLKRTNKFGGITVKADGSAKPFKEAGWIYHHKWQWVSDDYKGFDVEKNKQRSLQWSSLDGVDKSRIGQRKHWDDNVMPRITEAVSKDEVLIEPSVSELKELARKANYNSVRFTINDAGTLKAGDAENFTHQTVEPACMTIKIRGIIRYTDGQYIVKAYGAYGMKQEHDPKVDNMFKHGMVNGYDIED